MRWLAGGGLAVLLLGPRPVRVPGCVLARLEGASFVGAVPVLGGAVLVPEGAALVVAPDEAFAPAGAWARVPAADAGEPLLRREVVVVCREVVVLCGPPDLGVAVLDTGVIRTLGRCRGWASAAAFCEDSGRSGASVAVLED